jgi:hypothetical protein
MRSFTAQGAFADRTDCPDGIAVAGALRFNFFIPYLASGKINQFFRKNTVGDNVLGV